MLPLTNPLIKQKILAWEKELREDTGNEEVRLSVTGIPTAHIPLDDLATIVANVTAVSITDMKKPGKQNQTICTARQILCYYAYGCSDVSLPQLGQYLKRDHSTIHYSKKLIKDKLAVGEPTIYSFIQRINKKLLMI